MGSLLMKFKARKQKKTRGKKTPTCGAAVVRPRDRPERFLPRRVPDLQLDGLPIDLDGPRPELDADRQVMHGLEALVGELQQQAGLADAGVANDDVLEEVAVFVFIFPFFWVFEARVIILEGEGGNAKGERGRRTPCFRSLGRG
jgi:hypothetical protein